MGRIEKWQNIVMTVEMVSEFSSEFSKAVHSNCQGSYVLYGNYKAMEHPGKSGCKRLGSHGFAV